MILYSTSGKNQISDIDGSLAEGNYVEVVGYKECFTSKHKMWNKILEYRPVVEFTQVKLIKTFKQHSLGKVNTLLVKFYTRHIKSQVNILLSGVQKKVQKVQYALTTHILGSAISDAMLAVGLQYDNQYGLDWILSIDAKQNWISCTEMHSALLIFIEYQCLCSLAFLNHFWSQLVSYCTFARRKMAN